jgi:hypothetical protein
MRSIPKVLVAAGAAGALLGLGGVAGAEEAPFDEPGSYEFAVPADVCTVTVEALGASGGDAPDGETDPTGGPGARVTGAIPVTPGEVLEVVVGSRGGDAEVDAGIGGAGGSNGGGDGGDAGDGGDGGAGGGGASDVRQAGERILVAGGGGGAGTNNDTAEAGEGGAGGGAPGGSPDGDGADGSPNGVPGGGAGTVDGPGAGGVAANPAANGEDGDTAGVGSGGAGGSSSSFNFTGAGGGGGGGFHGGGGGAANNPDGGQNNGNGGGGGGASFATASAIDPVLEAGVNAGADGAVLLSYEPGVGCAVPEPITLTPRFTG